MMQCVEGVTSDGPSRLVGRSARRRNCQNDAVSRRQVDRRSIVSNHEAIRDELHDAVLLGAPSWCKIAAPSFSSASRRRLAGARKYFG
jgi:hypothetical protein